MPHGIYHPKVVYTMRQLEPSRWHASDSDCQGRHEKSATFKFKPKWRFALWALVQQHKRLAVLRELFGRRVRELLAAAGVDAAAGPATTAPEPPAPSNHAPAEAV